MTFALSADYPPFEFESKGELQGFDVDLAKNIAQQLGKEAAFQNIPFSAVLAAVQNGTADAAISTVTATPQRKKNFDFSEAIKLKKNPNILNQFTYNFFYSSSRFRLVRLLS